MNIETLKEKFASGLERWTTNRIDEMVKANPAFAVPSIYIKRASHNLIARNRDGLSTQIDNVALFITDENGEVNTDSVFDDFSKMLTAVEPTRFDVGIVSGSVGNGMITIDMPDNIITTIMFGSKKSIEITPDDILELMSILTEE